MTSASATRTLSLRTSPFVNRDSMFLDKFPQSPDEKPPLHSALAHLSPDTDKKAASKLTKRLCNPSSSNAYTVEELTSLSKKENFTPLLVAAANKTDGVLGKFLSAIGTRLSGSALKNAILAQDSQGWTAWHHAAAVTNQEGLRVLDEFASSHYFGNNLSSSLKNKGNQTPLDILEKHNFEENPPSLSRLFDEDGHLHTVKSIWEKFGIEYTDRIIPASHQCTWNLTTYFESVNLSAQAETYIEPSLKDRQPSLILKKPEGIDGYGLFAKDPIPRRCPIIVNGGLYSNPSEKEPLASDDFIHNFFLYNVKLNDTTALNDSFDGQYMLTAFDAKHIGNAIRWSNVGLPNATVFKNKEGQMILTAISSIEAGEQILWNYGSHYPNLNLGPMHIFNKSGAEKFFTGLKQGDFTAKIKSYIQNANSIELLTLRQNLEFTFSYPILVFHLVGNKIFTISDFEVLIHHIEAFPSNATQGETLQAVVFGDPQTDISIISRMIIMRLGALEKLIQQKVKKSGWPLTLKFFTKHAEKYSVAQLMKAVQQIENYLQTVSTTENYTQFLDALDDKLQSYRYPEDNDRPFKLKNYAEYLMRPHAKISSPYLKLTPYAKGILLKLNKEYTSLKTDSPVQAGLFALQAYLQVFSEAGTKYPILVESLSPIINILTLRLRDISNVFDDQYVKAISNFNVESNIKDVVSSIALAITILMIEQSLKLNE